MAVEKYPKDSQCNTWYGILLSLESLNLGSRRRIELAKHTKKTQKTSPPESSYDEALRYYLESYQVNPNLIFTSARIAQCYDKLKNKQAAKKWAEKALSRPGKDEEAIEAQEKCRKILKK
nr:hypothetical transcript [Hymenolepis microstoma]